MKKILLIIIFLFLITSRPALAICFACSGCQTGAQVWCPSLPLGDECFNSGCVEDFGHCGGQWSGCRQGGGCGGIGDQSTCQNNGCSWNTQADQWGGWSACSVSCGGGTQTRTNQCGQPQSQSCNTQPCCSGVYGNCTAWSSCSGTCGTRTCYDTGGCGNTQTQINTCPPNTISGTVTSNPSPIFVCTSSGICSNQVGIGGGTYSISGLSTTTYQIFPTYLTGYQATSSVNGSDSAIVSFAACGSVSGPTFTYAAGSTVACPATTGTVAIWHLDETSGSAAPDSSGNTGIAGSSVSDIYSDTAKINTGSSSNYQVASGQLKLGQTSAGTTTVYTYTSSGTFTPSGPGSVQYLIVGGGGGGGYYPGSGFGAGGGGAGGYRTATGFAVTAQGYTVTVGAGGLGSSSAQGANGSDSVFSTITSTGGGGGGRGRAAAATSTENGLNGGSGGGGGAADSGTAPTGGTATSGQGNDGKAGTANASGHTGGGGGAGGIGTTGRPSSGGVGSSSSISGSAVTYATGGGGGQTTAAAGAANTGNGGSGNEISTSQNGSDGGSGIVILRYTPLVYTTSGIIQSSNLLAEITTVNSIESLVYNLSSKPAGTTAVIQFSQNGTTWGSSTTLTTGANNSIPLASLGWSGSNFYYKITLTGDSTDTPVLDDITLNYTAPAGVNNGTATGTTIVNGRFNKARSFNGSSDYINIPNNGSLNPATAISVTTWVKTTDAGVSKQILGKTTGCATSGYLLWLNQNGVGGAGKPSFFVGGGPWLDSGIAINDGNWHQVAGTFDGTTAKIYVDGVLKNSGTRTGSLSSTSALQIGGATTGGGCVFSGWLNGTIDETRVYSRALSAAEITTEGTKDPCCSTIKINCGAYGACTGTCGGASRTRSCTDSSCGSTITDTDNTCIPPVTYTISGQIMNAPVATVKAKSGGSTYSSPPSSTNYTITSVPPGQYILSITPTSGYSITPQDYDLSLTCSDVTGPTFWYNNAAGVVTSNTTIDAGAGGISESGLGAGYRLENYTSTSPLNKANYGEMLAVLAKNSGLGSQNPCTSPGGRLDLSNYSYYCYNNNAYPDPYSFEKALETTISNQQNQNINVLYPDPTVQGTQRTITLAKSIPSGTKIIAFINGSLEVQNNITVAADTASGIMFILNNTPGNLFIDSPVTRLDGVYLFPGSFDDVYNGGNTSLKLTGYGSLLGTGVNTWNLGRTYPDTLGSAEEWHYAPKYLLIYNSGLSSPRVIWRELPAQ